MKKLSNITLFLVLIIINVSTDNHTTICKNTLLGDYKKSQELERLSKFDLCRYKNGTQPAGFKAKSPTGLIIDCSCSTESLCALFKKKGCENQYEKFTIPNILKPTKDNPSGDLICSCNTSLPLASPIEINVSDNNQQTLIMAGLITGYILNGIILITTLSRIILNMKKKAALAQKEEFEQNLKTLEAQLNLIDTNLKEKSITRARRNSLNQKKDALVEKIKNEKEKISKNNKLLKFIKKGEIASQAIVSVAKEGNKGLSMHGLKSGPESEIIQKVIGEIEENVGYATIATEGIGRLTSRFSKKYKSALNKTLDLIKNISLNNSFDINKDFQIPQLTQTFKILLSDFEKEVEGISDTNVKSIITDFKDILNKSEEIFTEQEERNDINILEAKLGTINDRLKNIISKADDTLKANIASFKKEKLNIKTTLDKIVKKEGKTIPNPRKKALLKKKKDNAKKGKSVFSRPLTQAEKEKWMKEEKKLYLEEAIPHPYNITAAVKQENARLAAKAKKIYKDAITSANRQKDVEKQHPFLILSDSSKHYDHTARRIIDLRPETVAI